jgi:hypothetical protein
VEVVKIIELKINEESEKFLLSQSDVTEVELKNCYRSFCENQNKRLTINEFIKELYNYGIYLININKNVITIDLI